MTMRQTLQFSALTAGALLLGGCQLFTSNTARLQAGIRVPEQLPHRDYAEQQLAAGRAALTAKNYVSAIAAFRNAMYEPEFAAAAHNGLGVAYAGIGRNDLAERFFRLALAEDPTVQRYADNLVRLQRANFAAEQARMARAEARPPTPPVSLTRAFRGTAMRASLEATPGQGRIERLGATGVFVRSPPTIPPAPRSAPTTPRVVVLRPSSVPSVAPTQPQLVPAPVKAAEAAAAEPVPAPLAPVQRSVTVRVTQAPEAPRAAIETTGRRYSPVEFSTVFAPYAERAEVPLLGKPSVSAPGLRPRTVPEPTFGQAESLALAQQ
jgi:hypothetical protein